MKKFFYKFSKVLSNIPINFWVSTSKNKLTLPFYHCVANSCPVHLKGLYNVRTEKQFSKEIDFLLKHYQPIDYAILKDHILNDKPFSNPSFLLSFDDGLREFYEIAAPILLKKGVPAICFVNGSFIDNKDMLYRFKQTLLLQNIEKNNIPVFKIQNWAYEHGLKITKPQNLLSLPYEKTTALNHLANDLDLDFKEYLDSVKPYMTRSQIQELSDKGFVFGGHSMDHPKYSTLGLEEQIAQTQDSIQAINDITGQNEKIFSFPFTDDGVSGSFFENVFKKKDPIAEMTFACAGLKNDQFKRNLQRIPVEIENLDLKNVLAAEYSYAFVRKILNKNQVIH